jgi:hypothetical protein
MGQLQTQPLATSRVLRRQPGTHQTASVFHSGTLHRSYSMAKRDLEITNLMLRTVLSDRTALESERTE